jgi:glycosyltransferase involved in cell wall biosynthesis
MKKKITILENTVFSTNTARLKLTQVLIDMGYDLTILSTGSNKEMEVARSRGFKIIDVGSSNTNVLHVFKYMRNLRREFKKSRPDVCLTFTMRPAIWGNMVTRALGIPTITNISGIGPLADSESFAYKVARTLYSFVLKKTAIVFFQNRDDLDLFLAKKFVRPEQSVIIPGSGVDYDYYAPLPQKRKDGKFVFLFISRLIKDKGILEYVEAAKQITKNYPGVVCQVLGPYYSQNLKENIITEKQIVQWVEPGYVNYLGAADDVRPFMAEADCIVLPSYREGMSNVLLEAGSMQKPCITSDTTGCNDIVVDGLTGYLCKVKDEKDLQLQMEKMLKLTKEERGAMGVKAREIMKTKFAKQIVVDAYVKAIESV